MKIERSMRPISFSALASAFWRGAAAIFLRMTDGGARPEPIEAQSRSNSSQFFLDDGQIGRSADQRRQWRIVGARPNHEQLSVAQIAHARSETITVLGEHCEDRLGCARGVSRMLQNL